MAEQDEGPPRAEETGGPHAKPEEGPCPQCGGPMVWVAGGPRCTNCGFKESCCF